MCTDEGVVEPGNYEQSGYGVESAQEQYGLESQQDTISVESQQ